MSSFLRNIEFWVTIVIGGLLLGFAFLIGDLKIEVATVGLYVSLTLALQANEIKRAEVIESSLRDSREIGLKISQNKEVRKFYENSVENLCKIFQIKERASRHAREFFYKLASSRLEEFVNQSAADMSRGIISFTGETFRSHYRDILENGKVKNYKSVTLVMSEKYLDLETGGGSIQFNYDLVKKGMNIERLFIIRDGVFDSTRIKDWIRDQQQHKITVEVAKEELIPREGDILHDFGIYGDIAVGYQILNDNCTTKSFQFCFREDQIEKASEQFKSLMLYRLSPAELEAYLKINV